MRIDKVHLCGCVERNPIKLLCGILHLERILRMRYVSKNDQPSFHIRVSISRTHQVFVLVQSRAPKKYENASMERVNCWEISKHRTLVASHLRYGFSVRMFLTIPTSSFRF